MKFVTWSASVLAVAAIGCKAKPQPQWTEYTSKDGAFTVSLPCAPREATGSPGTSTVDCWHGESAYLVGFAPWDEEPTETHIRETFEEFEKRAVDDDGKLVRSTQMTLFGHPAREVVVHKNFGGKFQRLVATKEGTYKISVIADSQTLSETGQRFFDSFRLNEVKGASAASPSP